jgi:SET domain-containing protein
MDNPKAVVRRVPGKGRGVFAEAKIKKGEEVAAWDGPVYGWRSRVWETNKNDVLHHAIQFEERRWRDSAGLARLLNHSCEANCGIKELFRIVAMRDIAPGEELCWDYEMTEDSSWYRMRCKCGTKSCRKVIGTYQNMPREARKRYRGHISSWLLEKYGP